MIISFGKDRLVHERISSTLNSLGCDVELAWDHAQLAERATDEDRNIELVIAGASDGSPAALNMLRDAVRICPNAPIIVWSKDSNCATIVAAMKAGAAHFLAEPFTPSELHSAVGDLLDLNRVPKPIQIDSVQQVGWEPKIAPLLEKLRRVDTPLLIQGETGVGKENLARKIHDQSLRAGKIFLKVNCAALPAELIESELFGYERGAFTGAFRTNRGKFEAADGGTMLLDEIGDMDLKVQAKLLQVLQDQEFIPLGARHPVKVDVRVIAATHRNLERLVEEETFREDLYYRLNVINLMIPPLRERLDEIPYLADHFLQKHSKGEPTPPVTPSLLKALMSYAWPGNLRELENLMRRYFVLGNATSIIDELRAKSAPGSSSRSIRVVVPEAYPVVTAPAPPPAAVISEPQVVAFAPAPTPIESRKSTPERVASLSAIENQRKEAQSEVILEALNATLWNRKEAAARLQIEYKALLYKMKKLNIGSKPPYAENGGRAMSAVAMGGMAGD